MSSRKSIALDISDISLPRLFATPPIVILAILNTWDRVPISRFARTFAVFASRYPSMVAGVIGVCHSFVTDGCVQFLGDLAEVAGQARAKGVTCEQAHMLLDEN